jgi:GR25 family glycosyltransferase involved in LPS biosynthesis
VVPVLIINLERDAARRDALTARLDALNVPYRIHKAMAGKDLPPDYLERHSPRRELAFGRELIPNEVATGLSHVAAVREGLGLGTEFFCVLEDDTIPAPRFAECLDEATLKALPEFDALRLFAHFDRWEKPSKTVATLAGSVVVRMLRPGWGCAGQIYTRRCGKDRVIDALYLSADRLCDLS